MSIKLTKRKKKIRELVNIKATYTPKDAIIAIKKAAIAKFDETIELAFKLGINPKHADQQIRTTVTLPAGTGKTVRVVVIAKGENVNIANEAGAEKAGSEELIEEIKAGWMDFDILLATPDMMPAVSKLGKILGPRGLMPNPKAGTVVAPEAIPRAIKEFKAGKIEFRNDKTGNIHIPIGKASFPESSLLQNFGAVVDAIIKAKPTTAKGTYIKNLVLSSTMGPGLKIDVTKLSDITNIND